MVAVLLPLCTYAQFSSNGSSFLARSTTSQPLSFDLPLGSAQPDSTATRPKPRLAAITTGWTYIWADEGGYRVNLNGWFLRPSVNFGTGYSVFFDSTNYYATNRKGLLNSHGYTAGIGRQFFAKGQGKAVPLCRIR